MLGEHIEGVFRNDVTHEVNEAPAASVLLKVSISDMLLSIKGTVNLKMSVVSSFTHLQVISNFHVTQNIYFCISM